ncbi:pheromone-regulated membrane protein [Ceratobasidium sp. AG-Ba]|nr:pheromone-regulated membrane protein [Ceratobasidium sp. AG-Ba]
MPSGNRFDLDGTSEFGPLDPSPLRAGRPGGDRAYDLSPESVRTNQVPHQAAMSDETLYNEELELEQFVKSPGTPKTYFSPIPGYPIPHARGGSGPALEAGPGEYREQMGTLSKLMHSYGFARDEHRASQGTMSTALDSRFQSQVTSRVNSNDSAYATLRRRRRLDSSFSMGGDALLDDDDPRVTGVKPNRIDDENNARETFKQSLKLDKKLKDPCVVLNVNTIPDRQNLFFVSRKR